MKFLTKIFQINILLFVAMSTYLMGSVSIKYIPIIYGDLNMVIIPYKDTSYVPPINSLASTTILTTNGKKIRVDRTAKGFVFQGYEDKIVLLEIYGSTCPHCINSIPGYNRVQAKYPDDVYLITLESYGYLDNAGLQKYVKDYNIQYDTVAKENIGNMFSFVAALTGWSPGIGVPYLMIFSKDGTLVERPTLGDIDEAYVDNIIKGLL